MVGAVGWKEGEVGGGGCGSGGVGGVVAVEVVVPL